MKKNAFVFLAAGSLLLLMAAGPPVRDIDLLQGSWRMIGVEVGGKVYPAHPVELQFEKDRITIIETVSVEGELKIDVSSNPVGFEKTVRKGAYGKASNRKIVGKCFLMENKYIEQTIINTRSGPGVAEDTWVLDGKKNSTGNDKSLSLENLSGAWSLSRRVFNGNEQTPEINKNFKFNVSKQNNKYLYKLINSSVTTATFSIDESKIPKHIDYLYNSGFSKNVKFNAIYKFDSGNLVIAKTNVYFRRPTGFSTKDKESNEVSFFKKVEPVKDR